MLALNADVNPDRCRIVGLVGTVALTAGGLTAGALPFRDTPPATSGRGALGLLCAYFGLVLLVAAWWWLGRAVRSPRPPAPRELLTTLAVWATPLLLGPPLFSRDVYSYLAQGAMVDARIDVYTHGPALLGGPLAAEVAPVWLHTPAPYGPVFLAVSAGAADLLPAPLAPTDVSAAVLGMRLVALLGVGLMALCLPPLADRCGVPRPAALWLGALNPLVLLHLVAGAHNDALMLGLLGAGLVVALGPVPRAAPPWAAGARPLCAALLVTLAALVKAPAALGLLAVAALWSAQLTGRLRVVRAAALTCAAALATTVLVTAVTGTGYGWLATLATPVSPDNWSLTSALGRLSGALLDAAGTGLGELAVPAWRWCGLAATAVAVAALWLRRARPGPVYALALSLLAVFALGPAFRPWYALWGLFLIAAAAPDGRIRRWTAAGSGVLALALLPSGSPPDALQVTLAVGGGALGLLALWWMFEMSDPATLPARARTAS
ncbi:polyprenol phosphomannose-dependent alpha 1,6 mannosyltransferase MptB [Streptomyces sp. NPDC087851]|uniref:polyprenol phosphomannose-dependent alpha 1,6 mannosyltransferase MptB n=1 Tax=Streptomyces sp. NPDC087851 TaxID=3365810 RepID=UPI003810D163